MASDLSATLRAWFLTIPYNDVRGILLSYVYAVSLLVIAQVLRSKARVPQDVTRKLVHVCAGTWCWAIVALFDHWSFGVIPFASFILVNFLLYYFRWLSAIDSPDRSPGTVYFAVVITLLFALLWRPGEASNRIHLALAGIMAMTWGDAMAAVLGVRYGRHRYSLMPGVTSVRSVEGSVTMFVVSALAIFITLTSICRADASSAFFSPAIFDLTFAEAAFASVVSASLATAVEAVSPFGTDNLTIPLTTASLLSVMLPEAHGK